MKTLKKNFKIISCDNAGETKTTNKNSGKNIIEIKFEFMSTGTPQQNSMVEQGFATLSS